MNPPKGDMSYKRLGMGREHIDDAAPGSARRLVAPARAGGNETGWAAAPTPSNPGSRSATAASSSEHSGLSWSNTSAPRAPR